MGDRIPWKHQDQPLRPFKAWVPNGVVMVRASKVMAEVDAETGAKETKTYGFAWDEAKGELLTCYRQRTAMDKGEVLNVLRIMAGDKTASPENRRNAKRILKAVKVE